MSALHVLMKRIVKLGLILMMGVSMSADAGLFGHTMSWKEEVLLHDGSKIIAERFYNLGGRSTIDSRERKSLDETVTFTLPGSNKVIIWKTDFRDSLPEPNSLNLLILDVVGGVPYIATYPAGSIAYSKWGSPNPPYVFFKYDGKTWQRISLEEFPAVLIKTNVIVGRPPAELLKSFYTVDEVEKQNYDIHQPEYKNIIRIPLDHWKPRSEHRGPKTPHPIASPTSGNSELIRTEDGWASPDTNQWGQTRLILHHQ